MWGREKRKGKEGRIREEKKRWREKREEVIMGEQLRRRHCQVCPEVTARVARTSLSSQEGS